MIGLSLSLSLTVALARQEGQTDKKGHTVAPTPPLRSAKNRAFSSLFLSFQREQSRRSKGFSFGERQVTLSLSPSLPLVSCVAPGTVLS